MIYDGALDALARSATAQERTLVVDLEEPAPPLDVAAARVSCGSTGRASGCAFRRDETSAAELIAAVAARARLVDLAIEEPDIEDIVRRIYAGGRSSSRVLTTTSAGGGAGSDALDPARGAELSRVRRARARRGHP